MTWNTLDAVRNNPFTVINILEKLAEYTGDMDYDSNDDTTSYSCWFCSGYWDQLDGYNPAGRLEKHDDDCPVALARKLTGVQINAYPVKCPICGEENWHNGEGWDGDEDSYIKYQERDSAKLVKRLDKSVKSGCCEKCSEIYWLYITNRNRRWHEKRRAELAQPGQLEKEHQEAVVQFQRHMERSGIAGKAVWDDDSHGVRIVQTKEERRKTRAEYERRVNEAIEKLEEGSNDEQV